MKCSTPMRRTVLVLGALTIVLTTACSNRQIYDAVRYSQMQECQKNPESIREDCMEHVSGPYDEYERSLQEVDEDAPER